MMLETSLIILAVGLVVGGLGVLPSSSLKTLINLEYVFLLVGVYLMLAPPSTMAVWYLFFIVFGACEGVWVLTVNMVVSKFVASGQSSGNKVSTW